MNETPHQSITFSALFHVTRFWNLAIIGLAQYMTVISLVNKEFFDDWRLFALSSSTILIAAAGYIINDYYDVKIDLINKPERVVIGKSISRRYAILLHTLLSFSGIGIGTLLDWKIGVTNFLAAFMLWWYSNFLKRQPFVGNLSVALLTGLSIVIIALLYPGYHVTTIFIYALFAFFVTLVREIIKDIEDLKGDNTFGCKTLPIIWGIRKTKNLIYGLTMAFISSVFFIHFSVEPLPMNYFVLFLFVPVAWLLIRLVRADTRKDFYQLSVLCKAIMLLGIFSMTLI